MLVDERAHFGRVGSSSLAKYAIAAFSARAAAHGSRAPTSSGARARSSSSGRCASRHRPRPGATQCRSASLWTPKSRATCAIGRPDQGRRGGAGEEGRALGQGAGRPAHRGEAGARRAAARAHDQGHGANLDLGVALMNGLAVVDAGDIDPRASSSDAEVGIGRTLPMAQLCRGGFCARAMGAVGGLLAVARRSLVGIISRGCRCRRGPHPWACGGLAPRRVGSGARTRVP
jgi:hypothetical protein